MSADLSDGQTFGAYHIVAMAGSGGMGVVYRAEQRSLGRTVALKVIRPEIAESGDYRSRFLREARLAAAVDHPHIVSVFDVGEHADRLYLTMQWVAGLELRAIIDRQRRLDPKRAVRIGAQLALALHEVHEAGLVHRDVKPSNILVRDIGGLDHAYLTDFGVAKAPDAKDDLTRTGWAIGTSGYLSPEQIQGQQPGPRSDLYALGCVIFEALTGQRPFGGENDLAVRWAHASSPRPTASAMCPALGSRYDDFLAKALAVDPQDRFPSGREFAAALQALQSAQSAPTAQPGRATPAARDAPTQLRYDTPAPPPAARPPGTLEPTTLRPAPAQPAASAPRPADIAAGAKAPPGATQRSARRPAAGPGRPAHKASRAGQLVVLAAGIVFLASVTLLTDYVNNGTGWKSLLEATSNDPASPLFPIDFRFLTALAAVAFIVTVMSLRRYARPFMIGAAAASLGLVGYTLYIPSKGSSPGFSPYGSSYWLSLVAAAAMALGAIAAARLSR